MATLSSETMKPNLSGRVAIVTASSSGIGFAIAQLLLEAGASVAICGRSRERLASAEKALGERSSDRVLAVQGDVAEASFLRVLVEKTTARFGSNIGVLVNNSGGPPPGEVLSKTDEDWESAIDNNFMSVVRMCRLVAPYMKKNGWGRIINLTSTAAREPAPGMVLSNSTRAAVAAYSKTLAHEVGPYGITVNTILTGGCLTDRLDSLLQKKIEGTGQSMEQAIEEIEKTIPVRHLATPEEFARIVLFLTAPEAGYLTGAAIPLDGGASKSLF
jgi:3-oxoacyl-[acyl-carrier protein] reductase